MRSYDQDYYFIRKENGDHLPSLTATEDTVDRGYTYQRQPPGSAPLMFFNGAKDYQKKLGIRSVQHPPDILFNGNFMVVRTRIRDALIQLDIPSLHVHPAVYMHDDGIWHEDYWFLAFSELFDCWDRERSDYEEEPLELGGFKLHSVYAYSLNTALLDQVPLERRLFFKMGGTQDGFMVCHQDIAGLFRGNGKNGALLQPISAY